MLTITVPLYLPKSRTGWFENAVMHLKDAGGMANSLGPDQTAPLVYTVCSDLSAPVLRVFTELTVTVAGQHSAVSRVSDS